MESRCIPTQKCCKIVFNKLYRIPIYIYQEALNYIMPNTLIIANYRNLSRRSIDSRYEIINSNNLSDNNSFTSSINQLPRTKQQVVRNPNLELQRRYLTASRKYVYGNLTRYRRGSKFCLCIIARIILNVLQLFECRVILFIYADIISKESLCFLTTLKLCNVSNLQYWIYVSSKI